MGARVKADERLFQKTKERGNDPSIIGDYLGGRMSVDTLEDAEKAIAAIEELGWRRPTEWADVADENFFWKPKGGYRARHVQLVDPTVPCRSNFSSYRRRSPIHRKKPASSTRSCVT